ncbi:hypothetical protein HYH03_006636 [Edaphochlamys debaryana]|uniref:PDZ domain-containing protein n=1 Tax=Edaphochlamys debaryana TaxID=47281 RepID=A0A835Y615_9CHLO|nr:hypothetical protein HYH03_006636 [Edaphochlamys debaryana]|eukprot:KAG2495368.1 hypothetical protein HYH03_006636 [Edaphochlamys debaryana]
MLLASRSPAALGRHSSARSRALAPRQRLLARAQQESNNGALSSADQVPIGCARYTVSLKKPLGIVLEQDAKSGNIFVVEVKAGGSAALDGRVRVGDQLIATTGVTYSREEDYNGATVRQGQQVVRMRVMGESFKTVSAAIGSHPGHMPVTLELQACDPGAGIAPGPK